MTPDCYRSFDPFQEQLLSEYPLLSFEEVQRLLRKSSDGFRLWKSAPTQARCHQLEIFAQEFERAADELATAMAQEMGKPVVQGRSEVQKCADIAREFARVAARELSPREVLTDASQSYVCRDPLGTVLGILPWNYPCSQFARFVVPALAAGNTVIVKPAPNVPRTALLLQELLDASFPQGVANIAFLSNEQVSELLGDAAIVGVTFTGSVAAGAAVARRAGECIKPVVLELGGSDPFIVLPDCDLPSCAVAAARSRLSNCGQTCISAKRFLVHRDVYEEFFKRFCTAIEETRAGDPLGAEVNLGPMAREDLRVHLRSQVQTSLEMGAKLAYSRELTFERGFFYPPQVLCDVPYEAPAWRDELFGPVAVLAAFRSDEEALRLANSSQFGLGASVWTNDRARAQRFARELEVGNVYVNATVRSDARLEFGGVKQSGFGRELGQQGLLEFVNHKTVFIS